MGILERDPDETAATLTAWLGSRAGVEAPRVEQVRVPASTGWSNETILFDARWRDGGGDEQLHELVARVAPSGYQVFPESTFLRQYAVMRALAEQTEVPMPRAYWLEQETQWFGNPFWIMQRVSGDIPSDNPPYAGAGWLREAPLGKQARAWWNGVDALVRVHGVDLTSLDLPADALPVPDDPLGAQLEHYERFLAWGEDGTAHPTARRALAVLHAERPPDPPGGPCLVWGDARLSNLVYQDFEVAAVLDWEMTGVGDPLLDLGWWLFADDALTKGSGFERLPGFATRAETAQRWSEGTGRSVDALPYYELFAGLRFTVIMLRMGKLLADLGFVPPSFAYDNLISRALTDLLETT